MEKFVRVCNSIFYYLCYFYIYSFMGWIIESIYVSVTEYRLASRGFLYGPLCPVYGFGFLLILTLLKPINKNILIAFFAAAVLTSILEYSTGFILESVFESRWWDYSEDILNLQGRISITTSLAWGFASVTVLNLIHPKVSKFVNNIPESYRVMICYLALFYLAIDLTASITTLLGIRILFPIFSMYFPI